MKRIAPSSRSFSTFESLEYRRLFSAGDLDPSFSMDGKATSDIGSATHDGGNAAAVQSDGKVVVVGKSEGQAALMRFNVNGTPDGAFGTGGKVLLDFGGGSDEANAVAIAPDGRIVVVGTDRKSGVDDFADIFVARYTAAGQLDNTFDGDGIRKLGSSISGTENGYAVAVQHDGKILVAGSDDGGFLEFGDVDIYIARLKVDGKLDNTFGMVVPSTTVRGGFRITGLGGYDDGYSIAVDEFGSPASNPNYGRIVVSGASYQGGHYRIALVRYKSNGDLDSSFDGDGKLTTQFPNGASASSVAIQSDHKIVIAGQTGSDILVARYNTSGALDAGFGSGGFVVSSYSAGNDRAKSLAIDRDGKIVFAGTSAGDFAVGRLLPSGNFDTSFSGDGKATTNIAGNDEANGLSLTNDGKIVVAGASGGNNGDFAVARYFDVVPKISMFSLNTVGAESPTDIAAFAVVRDHTFAGPTRVYYSVGGTATPPSATRGQQVDYTGIPGTLLPRYVDIPGGQSSVTIVITPIADSLNEGSETAIFTLSPSSTGQYTIGSPSSITLRIDDSVTSTTTLNATADAYVKDGADTNTNFGASSELQVKFGTSGFNRNAYIKFDLSTVSSINSVKLRLYGKLSSTAGTNLVTSVFGVSDTTWSESGITFNNRPATGSTALDSATIIDDTLRLYELDVTAYVQAEKAAGHNTVSFALKNSSASSPYVIFNSREAASGQPKLVVA